MDLRLGLNPSSSQKMEHEIDIPPLYLDHRLFGCRVSKVDALSGCAFTASIALYTTLSALRFSRSFKPKEQGSLCE